MIIDSHCHAGKGDGLTGPWDTAAPLDKYLVRAAIGPYNVTVFPDGAEKYLTESFWTVND